SSAELVRLLLHPNEWYARTARRILADRRDPEVNLPLRTLVREAAADEPALQALWTLYVSGGFTEAFGRELLSHRRAHARRCTVRLLGDDGRLEPATARELKRLAEQDSSPVVRGQLACTARRLPAADALPGIRALICRDMDANDPHIPLVLWWAGERDALAARRDARALVCESRGARAGLSGTVVKPRLTRRYAAEGAATADESCAALLGSRMIDDERERVWEALELGLRDRPGIAMRAPAILEALRAQALSSPDHSTLSRLMARLGDAAARGRLLVSAKDSRRPPAARVAAIEALGDLPATAPASDLLARATGDEREAVRIAALAAWARYGTEAQAGELVAAYPRLPTSVKARGRSVLFSRKAWAGLLLRAVDAGRVPVND